MKPKNIVSFNSELCKGCGLCISVCPVSIVKLSDSSINFKGYHIAFIDDMEKCVGCTNCALMCPDSVITIERMD
jgi:2-oxoglutarate ferredoxin oxidoreductase subunit delta